MACRYALFEVEKVEQLALIACLPPHHGSPCPWSRHQSQSVFAAPVEPFFNSIGQGQSRATIFNARNLCPKTARFLPWFPDEQALPLWATSNRSRPSVRSQQTPSCKRRKPSVTRERPFNLLPASRSHPRWALAAVNNRGPEPAGELLDAAISARGVAGDRMKP